MTTTTTTMIQTNTKNMNKNATILSRTLSSNSINSDQKIKTSNSFSKNDNTSSNDMKNKATSRSSTSSLNSMHTSSTDLQPKSHNTTPNPEKAEDEKSQPQQEKNLKKRKKTRKLVTISNLSDHDNNANTNSNLNDDEYSKDVNKSRLLFLPYNEYETVLKRRSRSKVNEEEGDDTSLGMKLTIMEGRVIVQSLNALNNGCASPAQLCGLINIGDVLVNVQNVPLRNLALEKIVDALKPLSDEMLDELVIRFAIGEGLHLLKSTHSKSGNGSAADVEPDLFSGFPLFPGIAMPLMPPPISQQPLVIATKKKDDVEEQSQVTEEGSISSHATNITICDEPQQITTTMLHTISLHITQYQITQDKCWPSPFYSNSTNFLLKPPTKNLLSSEYSLKKQQLLIFSHRQKEAFLLKFKGGAKNLCDYIQQNELPLVRKYHVSSNRSIASASHFSVANTVRRRQIKWDIIQEEDEDDFSNSSYSSTSQQLLLYQNDDDSSNCSTQQPQHNKNNFFHPKDIHIDPEHEFLGLLDDDNDTIVWKEQLVHLINYHKHQEQNSINQNNRENDNSSKKTQQAEEKSTLESLFFGNDVAKILTSQTISLPEKNVTEFLYHCIISKAPNMLLSNDYATDDAIVIDFNLHKYYSKDVTFLCKDVTPTWMTFFNPLGIDCRNLLFPNHYNDHKGINQQNSSVYQEYSDENTVITENTNNINNYFHSNATKNNHIIEDSKLDPDVRIQTCYILTFYFISEILPSLDNPDHSVHVKDQCNTFIKSYGAYLQLHPSFVHLLRSCYSNNNHKVCTYIRDVLESLLNIARVDYMHKEVSKELMDIDTTNITFRYEQVMLSPLLDYLFTYCNETGVSSSTGKSIPAVSLFVSAYPDLNPWFVRDIASTTQPDFYYSYLSTLLSPQNENTHNTAKLDQSLVMEWSMLSASHYHTSLEHKQNLQLILWSETPKIDYLNEKELFTVNTTPTTHMYNCNLLKLMEMSIQVHEYDIALNLGIELIQADDVQHQENNTLHRMLFKHLKYIASIAIQEKETNDESHDEDGGDGISSSSASINLLSKIILIYNKLSAYSAMYNIPEHILSLFALSIETLSPSAIFTSDDGKTNCQPHENKKFQDIIRLIGNKANPKDALASLLLLTNKQNDNNHKFSAYQIIPNEFWMEVLQRIVARDAAMQFKEELSGCLLIMNHLRNKSNRSNFSFTDLKQFDNSNLSTKEGFENENDVRVVNFSTNEESIWDKVLNGACEIDK